MTSGLNSPSKDPTVSHVFNNVKPHFKRPQTENLKEYRQEKRKGGRGICIKPEREKEFLDAFLLLRRREKKKKEMRRNNQERLGHKDPVSPPVKLPHASLS